MASQRNRGRPGPYSTGSWKDKKQNQKQHNKPPFKDQDTFPRQPQSQFPPNQQQGEGGSFDQASRDPPAINNDKEPFVIATRQENGRREKKFANRARVYVGNLPRGMTEDELMAMFKPYGEITQVYLEKEKNFGFARMVNYIFTY